MAQPSVDNFYCHSCLRTTKHRVEADLHIAGEDFLTVTWQCAEPGCFRQKHERLDIKDLTSKNDDVHSS